MYKLHILQVFDPILRLEPKLFKQINNEFETSSQAELRALRWLMYRPNDIIMLEEPEIEPGTGKHVTVGTGVEEAK